MQILQIWVDIVRMKVYNIFYLDIVEKQMKICDAKL